VGRSYEDLQVYQRAFQAALETHALSLDFPKIEQYALADQLRRSSKSICANIAEGQAKQHYSAPEFKRFLFMALGSSEEVRVWMRFAVILAYLEESIWQRLDNEYDEISKMLNGLIRSL
jgi:four helix bundle protein